MSFNKYTLGELREFTKDLPDETVVVGIHPGVEDWLSEGMYDGLHPWLDVNLREIRTGFVPDEHWDSTEYNNSNGHPILVLASLDKET